MEQSKLTLSFDSEEEMYNFVNKILHEENKEKFTHTDFVVQSMNALECCESYKERLLMLSNILNKNYENGYNDKFEKFSD